MEPLEPGDPRQIGPYRLQARLGAGGMGQVFLGFSAAGRPVAVKVVHPQLAADPAFRTRFGREVAAARAVSGAYTAPLAAAGPDDHPPWLATMFVAGPSLAEAVSAAGPLPEVPAWRLAAGLAEALAEIHARGLVHRDLKPANVLLALDGPRVIDFGISRALEATVMTATGQVVGTPAFMSPEQVFGRQIGPASDVFSLGGLITFASTGASPFGEGPAPSLLYRVVHAEPALDAVPGGLRDLAAACLAKDPATRPALAKVMETIAAGAPPSPASVTSFWPRSVADLIRAHHARLDAQLAGRATPPAAPPATQDGDAGPAPATASAQAPPGEPGTVLPGRPAGSPRAAGRLVPGLTRRRVLAGLAGAAAATGLAAAGWELSQPGAPSPGVELWSTDAGGIALTDPVAAGGVVYYNASPEPNALVGPLYALNASDGTRLWSFGVDGGTGIAPVVAGNVVYYSGARVYALDAASGRKIWSSAVNGGATSRVAVADGAVYVAGGFGGPTVLIALRVSDGKRTWVSHINDPSGVTDPVVADGVISVCGMATGVMYGIRPADGKHLWTVPIGMDLFTASATARGVIYVGAGPNENQIWAVRASDGTHLWTATLAASSFSGPTVADGLIFAGTTSDITGDKDMLYAVRASDGKPAWAAPVSDGGVDNGPVVAGGVVYVGHSSLHAIRAANGASIWATPVGGGPGTAPAVAGGVVYYGGADDRFHAVTV